MFDEPNVEDWEGNRPSSDARFVVEGVFGPDVGSARVSRYGGDTMLTLASSIWEVESRRTSIEIIQTISIASHLYCVLQTFLYLIPIFHAMHVLEQTVLSMWLPCSLHAGFASLFARFAKRRLV
jgi:hypothetical protein